MPERIRADAWSKWCQRSGQHRKKKLFFLQSSCEFKIQNTLLSISITLQTAIHAIHSFESGKPKLFQQTQPCELALRTAFVQPLEMKARQFTLIWRGESPGSTALSSWMQCCWSTEALGIHNMSFTIYYCCCKCWGNVFSETEKPYCIKMNRNVRIRMNFQNNLVRVKL